MYTNVHSLSYGHLSDTYLVSTHFHSYSCARIDALLDSSDRKKHNPHFFSAGSIASQKLCLCRLAAEDADAAQRTGLVRGSLRRARLSARSRRGTNSLTVSLSLRLSAAPPPPPTPS